MATYKLNVIPGGALVVVPVSQYDNSYSINFEIYNGSTAFDLTGYTARLDLVKADKRIFSGGTVTVSGNTVVLALENQITACWGPCIGELVFTNNAGRRATTNFMLDVEKSPIEDGIVSETVINYIESNRVATAEATAALEDATAAAEDATEAAELATTAATTAAQLAGAFNAEVKAALMEVINHIAAWTDGNAETYRNNLIDAMYANSYPSLVAIFLPGSTVIYTDDNLETVKLYLVVMYRETATSDAVMLTSNDYTLTGTLAAGNNTLVVSYNGLSRNVVVPAVDWYGKASWSIDADADTAFVARGSGTYTYSGTETSTAGLATADGTRYSAVTTRGKQQLLNAGRGGTYLPDTGYYPIPVMTGATQAVIAITPSTQYFGVMLWSYDSTTGYYTRLVSSGWQQGSYTMDLSSYSGDLYLTVGCKYDSEGADYPTPPESVSIAYS